jgi:uncharacterized protein
MGISVDHDRSKYIFTIKLNDVDAGYLSYEIRNGAFDIQHTVVYPQFRGKGLGQVLVEEAVGFAKGEGLKIVPTCSYAEHIICK